MLTFSGFRGILPSLLVFVTVCYFIDFKDYVFFLNYFINRKILKIFCFFFTSVYDSLRCFVSLFLKKICFFPFFLWKSFFSTPPTAADYASLRVLAFFFKTCSCPSFWHAFRQPLDLPFLAEKQQCFFVEGLRYEKYVYICTLTFQIFLS